MDEAGGFVYRKNAKMAACLDLIGLVLVGVFLTCLIFIIPTIDRKHDADSDWFGVSWMYSVLTRQDHYELVDRGWNYIWYCSMADVIVTLVQIGANVRLLNSLGRETQPEVTVKRTRFWLCVNVPVAVAYFIWRIVDGSNSGSAYWITLTTGVVLRSSLIFFVSKCHGELGDKVTEARELREAVRENRVNHEMRMMMMLRAPVGVDRVGVSPGSSFGNHLE